MNKSSRGGRPQEDIDQEFGENERTQKDAVDGGSMPSGDSGSFGAGRGDAEQEDDSLLAGGRKDVESQPARSGKSAHGPSGRSRR